VVIKYKLPFKFDEDYSFYMQRQSGSKQTDFKNYFDYQKKVSLKIDQELVGDLFWRY
jgi:hypothetical protein